MNPQDKTIINALSPRFESLMNTDSGLEESKRLSQRIRALYHRVGEFREKGLDTLFENEDYEGYDKMFQTIVAIPFERWISGELPYIPPFKKDYTAQEQYARLVGTETYLGRNTVPRKLSRTLKIIYPLKADIDRLLERLRDTKKIRNDDFKSIINAFKKLREQISSGHYRIPPNLKLGIESTRILQEISGSKAKNYITLETKIIEKLYKTISTLLPTLEKLYTFQREEVFEDEDGIMGMQDQTWTYKLTGMYYNLGGLKVKDAPDLGYTIEENPILSWNEHGIRPMKIVGGSGYYRI